jgi:arginine-tRNA-protein transferase
MRDLNFYLTPPHPCPYLDGRSANLLFTDPSLAISTALYGNLIEQGFRRNGPHLYRPHCDACEACIPVRVPVNEFQPRRRHQRVWRRNQDIEVSCLSPLYDAEHFQLYQRYLAQRHGEDRVGPPTPEQYQELFSAPGIDTRLYAFHRAQQLLAVAIIDHLPQGLSAVYTFFEPAESARSLGVYAVLWQVQEARRLGLPWLYLGYWIKECRKMGYKGQYRPLEVYRHNRWLRLL